MDAIRAAGLKLAVDPPGGAAVHYWEPINAICKLDIASSILGLIPSRSRPLTMTAPFVWAAPAQMRWPRLVGLKDRYRFAFGDDADTDRHGMVTPAAGLMNPNHYLSVAILYVLTHRPD